MSTSYGFNSVIQTFSPLSIGFDSKSSLISARVIDIILDDKHKNFKNQGAWDSIGTIKFKPIYAPTPEVTKNAFFFAKPFFSNLKHYPLKNEVVFIVFLSNQSTQNTSDGSYYYINPTNVWSSVHHNALPDISDSQNIPEEQKRDYIQTSAGAFRRISDNSSEINLGDTFKEKSNIHSLIPYEGDTIVEGRWGQSIRFGSTVSNGEIPNLWSNSGNNGDPLILIRNNQSSQVPKEGWVPILEDINEDGSSIYLTSRQSVPIVVSSNNVASFNTAFENKSQDNIILVDSPLEALPENKKDSLSQVDEDIVFDEEGAQRSTVTESPAIIPITTIPDDDIIVDPVVDPVPDPPRKAGNRGDLFSWVKGPNASRNDDWSNNRYMVNVLKYRVSGKRVPKSAFNPPKLKSGYPIIKKNRSNIDVSIEHYENIDYTADELKMMYERILQNIGAPLTEGNIIFMKAWRQAEGGEALNNPWNSTQRIGSKQSNYNTVPVQNYFSIEDGIKATVITMTNGYYNTILKGLRKGLKDQAEALELAQLTQQYDMTGLIPDKWK